MNNPVYINKREIAFSGFNDNESGKLLAYLQNLSELSRKRFGPHPFNPEAIVDLLKEPKNNHLFIAKTTDDDNIIAYAILKRGWLDFETTRLSSYGLIPGNGDFTFAPSVADNMQGLGLGSLFLTYILNVAKEKLGTRRIILWGGVQTDNEKAVRLYLKFGFRQLGRFEHNGQNMDMICELENISG